MINNERNAVNDMRNTLESDEEKIRDLVNALEIEQAELKEIRFVLIYKSHFTINSQQV